MGNTDRIIRTIIAIALLVLIFAGYINATWAVVAGVAAIILLLTSVVGFCPAYLPFGISGRRERGSGS